MIESGFVLVISIVAALLSAWWIVKPLFSEDKDSLDDSAAPHEHAGAERERLRRVAQDLELDYMTNRISKDEYAALQRELLTEVAKLSK